MKRSFAAVMGLLCACAHAPHASPPPPALTVVLPRNAAHLNLARIIQAQPAYAAIREYDRQIAALRAAFPPTPIDPVTAQRYANDAASTAARIPGRMASADEAAAARLLDPASLRAAMQSRYTRQAASVRALAGASSSAYLVALQRQQRDATTDFARALETRAERAYANRVQGEQEHEANDALMRDRAIADQRMILSLKLHDLHPSAEQRERLQKKLRAIDTSLAMASTAERAKDRATLMRYRTVLQRAAVSELSNGSATMRNDAGANWQIRQRVTNAQAAIPLSLSLANVPDEQPQDATTTTAATADAMRSAGTRIAGQMKDDLRADAAGRHNAVREIAALQTQRDTLYRSIVWNVCNRYRISGCGR